MRLHKTGHIIADTVSDIIGELEDGDYNIVYGILRHNKFREGKRWFELDKGFWGASHYSGNYRISYKGTQPIYREDYPLSEPHGQTLEPWRNQEGYTLICPPTGHVCDFFKIDYSQWLMKAINLAASPSPGYCERSKNETLQPLRQINYIIRNKDDESPIEWDKISKVTTFNSTIGFEALRRGIPVISDPKHSTIGSYTSSINSYCDYDRDKLFSFCQAHQFRLSEKPKILSIIKHYLERAHDTERLDRTR